MDRFFKITRLRRGMVASMIMLASWTPLKAQNPPKGGEDTVAYWVTQLDSDQYLRRELAVRKLVDAGPSAIDDLIAAMRSGDLEVVERASDVISRIAMSSPPADDGGAWDRLNTLANDSVGRASSRAKTAIEEIREHRSLKARTELVAAGVFVGLDEYVIRAVSEPLMIVQIDEKWQGDVEVLQWLQWLDGVQNARVKGPAITKQVMAEVAKLPELKSLSVVDGSIDDSALQPLTQMEPINALEFRYVRLTDDQGDKIAAMPVRVSLTLMGTGVSTAKVEAMRAAAPGLQIDHRMGGFMGVKCNTMYEPCEISDVVNGSAAAEAGLLMGDVILQLDDIEISRFQDLQNAINQHVPGDTVKVKYRRAGVVDTLDMKLRRYED